MSSSILKSSSSSSPSSSTRQRVRFNKRVQAVHTRHHRDYTKKEFQSCYQATKEEVNHTLEYFHRQSQSDLIQQDESCNDFCLRGLEHRTATSHKGMKAYLRRAAWMAVLEEQEKAQGNIAEVYAIYSLPACRIALQRAHEDAIEAGYTMQAEPPLTVLAKNKKNTLSSSSTVRRRPDQRKTVVSQAA